MQKILDKIDFDKIKQSPTAREAHHVAQKALDTLRKPTSIVPILGLLLVHAAPVYLNWQLYRLAPQIRHSSVITGTSFIAKLMQKQGELAEQLAKPEGMGSRQGTHASGAEAANDEGDDAGVAHDDEPQMLRMDTDGSARFNDDGGDGEDKTVMVTVKLFSIYSPAADGDVGAPVSTQTSLKAFKALLKGGGGLVRDKSFVTVPRATLLALPFEKVISLFVSVQDANVDPVLALDVWNLLATALEQGLSEAVEQREDAKFRNCTQIRQRYADTLCALRYQGAALRRDPRAKVIDEKVIAWARDIIRAYDVKLGNPTMASLRFLKHIFDVVTLTTLAASAVTLSIVDVLHGVYFTDELIDEETFKNVDFTDPRKFVSHVTRRIIECFGISTFEFSLEQAKVALGNYAEFRINNSARAEASFGMLVRDFDSGQRGYDRDRNDLVDSLQSLNLWTEFISAITDTIAFVHAITTIIRHPMIFLVFSGSRKLTSYPYSIQQYSSSLEQRLEKFQSKGPQLDVEDLFDLSNVDVENNPEAAFLIIPEDRDDANNAGNEDGDGDDQNGGGGGGEGGGAERGVKVAYHNQYHLTRRNNWCDIAAPKPNPGLILLGAVAAAGRDASAPPRALLVVVGAAEWPAAPCDVAFSQLLPSVASIAESHFSRIGIARIHCVASIYAATVTQQRLKKWRKRSAAAAAVISTATDGAKVASAGTTAAALQLVPRMEQRNSWSISGSFMTLRSFGCELEAVKSQIRTLDANDDDPMGGIASSLADRADALFERMSTWVDESITKQCDPPLSKIDEQILTRSYSTVKDFTCRVRGVDMYDSYYTPYDSRDDPVACDVTKLRHTMKGSSILIDLGNVATMGRIDENSVDNTYRLLAKPSSLMRQCFSNLDDIPNFSVEFQNVSFHYTPEKPILQSISFKIESGEFVGLVGESGCGKSTVFSLIARDRDPTAGRILINGKDIRAYPTRWLRRRLARSGQNSDDNCEGVSTIEHLLLLRDPLAKSEDPDAVVRALQKAYAYEFVMERPLGIHASADSDFSGGQEQRLNIAGALMKNPRRVRCFLFDEATSALDVVTERRIQASIEAQGRGTDGSRITCIAAAHRLSTLRNCDKIIVIKKGRVAQQGKWDELMRDEHGDFVKYVVAQEVRDFNEGACMEGEGSGGGAQSGEFSVEYTPSTVFHGDETVPTAKPMTVKQQELHKTAIDDNALLTAALDFENALNDIAGNRKGSGIEADKLQHCFDLVDAVKARFGIAATHLHHVGSSDDAMFSQSSPDGSGPDFTLADAFIKLPARVNLRRNEPKVPDACFDAAAFLRIQSLLPMHLKSRKWAQCYSSEEVGFALATLQHEIDLVAGDRSQHINATVLIVSVAGGKLLVGAFLPVIPDWTNRRYTVNAETFVFRVEQPGGGAVPMVTRFASASALGVDGGNEYHFKCFTEDKKLLIGGGGKGPAIALGADLDVLRCSTDCPTFVMDGQGLLPPWTPGLEVECGVAEVPIDKVEVWAITAEPFVCPVSSSCPGSPLFAVSPRLAMH